MQLAEKRITNREAFLFVKLRGLMGSKLVMWNLLSSLLLLFLWISSVTASVSYDSKAIIVNGQRRILISGSIHYPRSSPEVFSKCTSGSLYFELLLAFQLKGICSSL